jgi:predicted RNA-binding protein with PIN domain
MADPAPPADEPRIWLVDGFNLMHAAVLRGRDRREWWRAEARERVLALVRRLDAAPDAEVVVVFDGQRPADEPEQPDARPQVVFAASADEWLIRAVRGAPDPGRIAVVTADRQLADRARHRGARVVGPRAFRERCGGPA